MAILIILHLCEIKNKLKETNIRPAAVCILFWICVCMCIYLDSRMYCDDILSLYYSKYKYMQETMVI